MIGSTVDKYEVLQKVGEGGMATVYRGRHTTLDREVAIKVLHPHLSSSTRNRKRFAREARAIEHLRHANILEIFDYSGIESGDCYIITEFVQGQTLSQLAEDAGPLPSELAARIGIKLCEALSYAHAAGILHRDLKPDNVMIRVDGTVKLMDFGIARFLDESQVTLTGALVGSPAFMSPEQAVEGDLGLRSDLFSLGTMLFYLVSAQLPFAGSNPSVILKKVIEGDRPNISELVPTISPTLADVIERLMATSPEGRFNTGAEVAAALTASLDEVGIGLDSPEWKLTAWLDDSDDYRKRLEDHVSTAMLAVGKDRLAQNDPLGALRLFNRLLALDAHNEEVLALIQGLHTEPERPRNRALPFGIGLAAVVLLLGGGLAFFALPQPRIPPPDPVLTPEQTPLPSPSVVVPEPEPLPLPEPEIAVEPVPAPPALPTRAPTIQRVIQARDLARGPATLKLKSSLPADVFHEGRRLGSTRKPITLQPGSYVLEVKSDVVEPYELRVEVSAGEKLERTITVRARPAVVRLASSIAPPCRISLDGVSLGTAGELGYRVTIPRPDQPGHRLEIACGSEAPSTHVWSGVVISDFVVEP